MLEELRIQNFKGWQDTGTIRMAAISLFFGANSSGKSSIGQFLMMLKQTVSLSDRKAVFYPGNNDCAVQLGSYREMVFQRDTKKKIIFDYRWSLSKPLKFKDRLSGNTYSGDFLSFKAEVGLAEDKKRLRVEELTYKLQNRHKEEEKTRLKILMRRKQDDRKYEVEADPYKLTRNKGRGWALNVPVRFYGFPDEVVAYYQNAEFVQNLNLRHEELFRSLCYLGPLRTKANRLYSWSGEEPESVGYAGEHTIAAILAAKDRQINLGHNRNKKPFQEILALQLKYMGLIEEFKVESIAKQRREYEVKIRTKGSKNLVGIPDVGFGISQVLPVLVQCFYAPQGSIIIMEQPEIHLHPNAQSALADVMINVINSKEDGKKRNIQLIIETHSEHFLRRLQRRIAEGKLSNEEMSAYFIETTEEPATLKPLEVDQFGNIQNWPENFFGDEMGDICAQAKAGMKRRMQKT